MMHLLASHHMWVWKEKFVADSRLYGDENLRPDLLGFSDAVAYDGHPTAATTSGERINFIVDTKAQQQAGTTIKSVIASVERYAYWRFFNDVTVVIITDFSPQALKGPDRLELENICALTGIAMIPHVHVNDVDAFETVLVEAAATQRQLVAAARAALAVPRPERDGLLDDAENEYFWSVAVRADRMRSQV